MARIYPFRALRYNSSRVRLADVVTQPYDKITPSMQQAYYQRSPYNLVRLILGLPELFDSESGPGRSDIYTRAARDFADWRAQGILSSDQDASVFSYSQRFTVPNTGGRTIERRGFIALGQLYEYSQGVVFRHEQTLPRPKSDRLQLLRATRAHFGQIFMLYSDPAKTAESLLFSGDAGADIEVTDEFGTLHRVLRVSDPATINLLSTAMADKKLIIADGHHRYETALAYARERAPSSGGTSQRNAHGLPQPPYPEAAAMMTFVNMESEGLVILPTHRVVFGLKGFAAAEFLEKAAHAFHVEALVTVEPEDLSQRLAAKGAQGPAFVAVTANGRYLLRPRSGAISEAIEGLSPRHSQLDIVKLHYRVLHPLLGIDTAAIDEERHLRYVREAGEAIEQVATGRADIAFLVNPVTLSQLREIAFAGEVMPQKSTDFYPKLLSGLAIYALD